MKFKILIAVIVTAFLVQSCSKTNKKLSKAISDNNGVKTEVVIQDNMIIVQLNELVSLRHPSYELSKMVNTIVDVLGKSDFEGFSSVRFDVASLHTSFTFPTKIVTALPKKLEIIYGVVDAFNKEQYDETHKKFDDIITEELYEEQIVKEWNELLQMNEMKPIKLELEGYEIMQLPGEEGYFVQLGFMSKSEKGNALVEFLFAETSKKVIKLNVTLL